MKAKTKETTAITSAKYFGGNMTYWNHQGKYQEESEKLLKQVKLKEHRVDSSLETLRLVAQAYYDAYNNAGANSRPFEELRDRLIGLAGLPFSPQEWAVFEEWLNDAAESDRDYMFTMHSNENRDQQILKYFERLADWAIERCLQSN